MSGNSAGGKKAAKTNRKLYGKDIYKRRGKQGAEAYRFKQDEGTAKPRGFSLMSPERLSEISKKGGESRSGYRKPKTK